MGGGRVELEAFLFEPRLLKLHCSDCKTVKAVASPSLLYRIGFMGRWRGWEVWKADCSGLGAEEFHASWESVFAVPPTTLQWKGARDVGVRG